MKWTLKQIRDYRDQVLNFETELLIEDALIKREPTVIHLDPVQVAGYLVARGQEYVLHCQLETTITLPSSRTLEPTPVKLSLPIKERYVGIEDDSDVDEYEETTIVLEHDYIDLEPAVLDAISLNLPVRVIGEHEDDDYLPSGNDWTVVTEESYQQQIEKDKSNKIDPRFANLKALLDTDQIDE